MYLRNILAAASFVAMVASAALPQTDGAYVPGFEKSCVEGCKSSGTANVRLASSVLFRPNAQSRGSLHGCPHGKLNGELHGNRGARPAKVKAIADLECAGELLRMVPSVRRESQQ